MFHEGQELFVHLGGEGRVLHAIKVTKNEDGASFVSFTGEDPPSQVPDEGDDVIIFFNGEREFMQQPGRITGACESEARGPFIGIETTGEAVSAESRQCFRVCTVICDLSVGVGDEGECSMADVSAMGVAVISSNKYQFGEVVDLTFTAGGREYSGRCCVQSIKEVKNGARYGLLAMNDGDSRDLTEGLQKLTMDAQRVQLRRLAGAA